MKKDDMSNMNYLELPKTRHKFTEKEDKEIIDYVKQFGVNNWVIISHLMKNRSSRQLRERYCNYLSPDLKKSEWSQEEDEKLCDLVKKIGKSWRKISQQFDGRTEVNLKNRYRLLERRERKYKIQMKEKIMKYKRKTKKNPTTTKNPQKYVIDNNMFHNEKDQNGIFDNFIDPLDEHFSFDDFVIM